MLVADCEAVWFWHPLLVLNLRRLVAQPGIRRNLNPQMTVTTKNSLTEESTV